MRQEPGESGLPIGPKSLEQILITHELEHRPVRPPDFAAENRALLHLAEQLATAPESILQRLAEEALRLCDAGSSGISLAEVAPTGAEIFRWHAVAGRLAPFLHGTMPREFSPCGVTVARNATQLMRAPIDYFAYIGRIDMHLEEVMLVPFHRDGEPIGTIWVVQHDDARPFDAEDRRVLGSLATFTSAAAEAYRRTQTLRATVEALEAEREMRERFIQTLTHDLRSPLMAARIAAEMLQSAAGGSLVGTNAARVTKNIDRVDRMIRDLLDASRIKAGEGIALTVEPFDLHDLVDEVTSDLSRAVGPRFVICVDRRRTATGTWDRDALIRVIENLTSNAVKYGASDTPITISVRVDGAWTELGVHNHGAAIPAEDQESIFAAYSRTQAARASGQKGWGLGLTLVRGIAEAHGGTARVDSGPAGTSFTVRLPNRPP